MDPSNSPHPFPLHHQTGAAVFRSQPLQHDAAKELEYLAFAVSHDLVASVRHVSSFGEMILSALQQSETDPERIHHLSNTFRTANQQLSAKLQAILFYSRIGRHQVALEVVDTCETIARVLERYDQPIRSRKVQLDIEGIPRYLLTDDYLLGSLFDLLLSNAMRFTQETSLPVIRIWGEQTEEGWLTFTFQDNGIGFLEERKERLFQLFSVVHARSEYPHVGLGTGLAIAKRIVDQLGGHIDAQSRYGQGATFTVTLPLSLPASRND